MHLQLSPLLELILKEMPNVSMRVNKPADADVFLAATFNVLDRLREEGFGDADASTALRDEAVGVQIFFRDKNVDPDRKGETMETALKELDVNTTSVNLLRRAELLAELNARKDGKEYVTAMYFLTAIFATPTQIVKEKLLGEQSDDLDFDAFIRLLHDEHDRSLRDENGEDENDETEKKDDADENDGDESAEDAREETEDDKEDEDAELKEKLRLARENLERRKQEILRRLQEEAESADDEEDENDEEDAKPEEDGKGREEAMRKFYVFRKKQERETDENDEIEEDENEDADPPSFSDLERMFMDVKRKKEEEKKREEEKTPFSVAGASLSIKAMQESLLKVIYGQDFAVNVFTTAYFRALLQTEFAVPRKGPRGIFLFAGPSGVGKTFLAEEAAQRIGLPSRRFNMSEYADKESSVHTFLGMHSSYKSATPGLVTSFVKENPESVLIFDEVEKAHLNVINLFLQILDDGVLQDECTREVVSFKDTFVIFTTNAGKQLYEDDTILNLSAVSQKSIVKALRDDKNPVTGEPYFPQAICSRFASGNVVMFNHLQAHHLLRIAREELQTQSENVAKLNVKPTLDAKIPYCLMFGLGGKADARTVRAKADDFLFNEINEFYRLVSGKTNKAELVESIDFKVTLPDTEEVVKLFACDEQPEILLFAGEKLAAEVLPLTEGLKVHVAEHVDDAKKILFKNVVTMILVDPRCNLVEEDSDVLNVDDVPSEGRDFIAYLREFVPTPHYLLQEKEGEISRDEFLSFSQKGARALMTVGEGFRAQLDEEFLATAQQRHLDGLVRANKVLTFKTAQELSEDGKTGTVTLFDFKLKTAVDAEDAGDVLSDISRPAVTYADVIGAKDAKEELSYFVEFMKNPAKFVRRGVKAPKGIILYGPPGTGKTLLAKATAGESNVTFIASEGNAFLRKGAEEVHEIFRKARKYAPSILFIDEIDAIAKSRGTVTGELTGSILTAFLTEMDGFKTGTEKPVFVLAATNYPVEPEPGRVALDPALMRRFDRKILVDLPERAEREEFIRMKMRKNTSIVLTDEQVRVIAMRSTGMSLSDLDSVFELALRTAIRSENCNVTDKILEDAFETYNNGEVKKWDDSSLLRTARHEAGHAVMCYLGGEKPSYLTIVARSGHGGYMQHADNDGKGTYRKAELVALIRTALAGRAAEIVYYGDEDGVDTGASSDLRNATGIAERMICYYGMDDKMGMATIDPDGLTSSFYQTVHARVNEILAEEFAYVKKVLREKKAAIDELVNELLEKNSMKEDEIDAVLKKYVD